MRLKLDENVTVAAKDPLVALGHQVDTVADEDLTGRPDPDVLAAAIAEDRALAHRTWLEVVRGRRTVDPCRSRPVSLCWSTRSS